MPQVSRVYVASSWRNVNQPAVVSALQAAGFTVYDFRNPQPGQRGFDWSEISEGWKHWSPDDFRRALASPAARRGFGRDMEALDQADAVVLVLPCGRSAHLELGYAIGQGKLGLVLCDASLDQPELMYLMCQQVCLSIPELIAALASCSSPQQA